MMKRSENYVYEKTWKLFYMPYRNHYAKEWEDLGELQGIVMTLLRGRYWNSLKGRAVPFYQEKQKFEMKLLMSLPTEPLKHQDDVVYGLMRVTYTPMAKQAKQDLQNGYQLRQPLNEGINSISYMEYFQNLYCKYYKDLKSAIYQSMLNLLIG